MWAQSPLHGPIEPSQPQNATTLHQLNTDATRAESGQAEFRFNPYPKPRARRGKRTNAEAGSSAVDAEKNQKNTEEDKLPAATFTVLAFSMHLNDHPASDAKQDSGPQRPRKTSQGSRHDPGEDPHVDQVGKNAKKPWGSPVCRCSSFQ